MIVIPMAGLSRRFTEAGYTQPKYMLPLPGGTVFDHAVRSFEGLFESARFLFIGRNIAGTEDFVKRSCTSLGVQDFLFVALDAPTAGQAETVELGMAKASVSDDEAITLFNIDTFRPQYSHPVCPSWGQSDGYLEVFRGTGANWSYVRPADSNEDLVAETAEKRIISDLCCSGLYHFACARSFRRAIALERTHPSSAELYVAPIYNHLIADGCRIHYRIISCNAVVFCGVPSEYKALSL